MICQNRSAGIADAVIGLPLGVIKTHATELSRAVPWPNPDISVSSNLRCTNNRAAEQPPGHFVTIRSGRPTVFRQYTSHNILVDLDTKQESNLLSDAPAA